MNRIRQRLADAWCIARGGDLSVEAGGDPTRDREARLILTSLSMVMMRVVSFAVNILSIGLLHRYLDPVSFGLWLTLSSLWLVMVLFADAGLAHSLVNSVARRTAVGDWHGARAAVSSAVPMLVILCSITSMVAVAAAFLLPWHRILNIDDSVVAAQFPLAFCAMALATTLGPLVGVAPAVMKGLQRAYLSNIIATTLGVVALGALFMATRYGASFPTLAFVFFLAPLAAMMAVNVVYFATSGHRLRPTRRLVQRGHMRDVLQVGGALFALQACGAIIAFSDSILISIVLGPERVADVAVPARLFSVVSLGVTILLAPLWPAYTDALARGEIEWVKRTFRRSLMIVALLAPPGAVVMLALHEAILAAWMGPTFAVNRQAVIALAVWCVIEASMMAIAMLLNAAQVFRLQLILTVSMMVASIALRFVLLNWIGVAGAPIASILAFMLTTLIPMCLLLPGILRNLGERVHAANPR